VSTYHWAVFIPGEDLPRELSTDYLLTEGEEISVDGQTWIVEEAEPAELLETDDAPEMRRRVTVTRPHEPTI
jgi:hypothetical protein